MKIIHKDTPLITGLALESRGDGVWLRFESGTATALINLTNSAKSKGENSLIGKTMLEWLKDYATTKEEKV